MTRRSWIIFLQAGVVGVLLVVVYLTILQPDNDSSVSGVTAPGAQGPVATKPPDRAQHQHRERRRANQPRQRGPARVVTVPGAPGAGPTVPAPVAAATPTSVPVGPTPSVGGPGESPSDDQYSGTLARLNSALR